MKTAALGKYLAMLSGRDRSPGRFRDLSARYYDNAYNWALRYTGSAHDAQDLVQETFMAAFENFGTLKAAGKFKSWLFSIMRNQYVNQHRNTSRYRTESIEENNGYLAELEYTAQSVDTERMYEMKVEASRLHQVLNRLTEEYKSPLILYYLEDFSYREIANTLNIPVGTVMSRLSRGKKALKKEILRQSRQRVFDTPHIRLAAMKGKR